ncbi:MAG: alpha/beta hydrolase [Eubacterium sp.]|nr:alpha/beta hydrolase [Eubacterium sp.]
MNLYMPALKFVWNRTKHIDAKRMKKEKYPGGIEEFCNIPYIEDGNMYHLLDVYVPENTEGKLPVIIDIHGGGWMYGTKELNRCYCHYLAKEGFIVVNINYRLAGKVFFRNQIKDIFAAFKWVSENMNDFPADMNNVYLTGDSAGSHFVTICAALSKSEELRKDFDIPYNPLQFNAIGTTSPVVDLTSRNILLNSNLRMLLGSNHKLSPFYKYMKFDEVAVEDMPPFYIVTSSGDFVRTQSYKLKNVLDHLGVENKLMDWKFKYKGKKLPHCFAVLNSNARPSAVVRKEMAGFFKQHIK